MREEQARFHEAAVGSSEFPDLLAVYDYWLEVRGERSVVAPAWSEIDLIEIPASILPRICVVDVEPAPVDFTYRYWGTAITSMHHYDLTGKSVLTLTPKHYARCIWSQYKSVFDTLVPKCFITEVPLEDGRYTYYAAIRLPLSSDGATLDAILSAEEYGTEREQLAKHFDVPRR